MLTNFYLVINVPLLNIPCFFSFVVLCLFFNSRKSKISLLEGWAFSWWGTRVMSDPEVILFYLWGLLWTCISLHLSFKALAQLEILRQTLLQSFQGSERWCRIIKSCARTHSNCIKNAYLCIKIKSCTISSFFCIF